MRAVPASLLFHAVSSGALAVAATLGVVAGALDSWLAWALVSAHGAGYLVTAMQPHLFGGRPRRDVPAAVLTAGLLAAPAALDVRWSQLLALATLAYLVLRALRDVRVVLRAYRDAWVWVNPTR